MPVRDNKSKVVGKCPCCISNTKQVTGTVFINNDYETLYLARWTVQAPNHGIAFLILIPETGTCVSILYSFEEESFMVVGEDGYDWHLSDFDLRVLDRNEVIGTPLAELVFAYLDEIWIHDRELRKFHEQPNKR
jgi:hypothetical protein